MTTSISTCILASLSSRQVNIIIYALFYMPKLFTKQSVVNH